MEETLKNLAYSLKYSGFIINMIAIEYGGDAWLKTNYNISDELFSSFKKKAKELNIIEKINIDFKYKTKNITEILNQWIGNKNITKYIEYDIKKIMKKNKTELYFCELLSKNFSLAEYHEIFDSIALAGIILIFKSEKNITSISLHWAI